MLKLNALNALSFLKGLGMSQSLTLKEDKQEFFFKFKFQEWFTPLSSLLSEDMCYIWAIDEKKIKLGAIKGVISYNFLHMF